VMMISTYHTFGGFSLVSVSINIRQKSLKRFSAYLCFVWCLIFTVTVITCFRALQIIISVKNRGVRKQRVSENMGLLRYMSMNAFQTHQWPSWVYSVHITFTMLTFLV